MLGDVRAALDFLTKQKNVDPDRIAIVGASYSQQPGDDYLRPTIQR